MITKTSKWILYISSYIPLYIIFIVSNIFDVFYVYNKIKNIKEYSIHLLIKSTIINVKLIIVFTILIVFSLILLFSILSIDSKSSTYKNFYSLRRNNEKINEYILVYILPFITVKSNDYKELTIFLLIFILIGIISVKNDLVYVNPILYLLKYNIYLLKYPQDAIDESILITKYSIIEMKKISKESNFLRMRASKLSEKIYFIKK